MSVPRSVAEVLSEHVTLEVEGIDRSFDFREGETIHTENSHKWSAEDFAEICRSAGLDICRTWHDAKGWFALNLLHCGEQTT